MTRNTLFALNTSDKLHNAMRYLQKLSNDLAKENSIRDNENSAALFYLSSIVLKMIQATNKNDIDTTQRIAIELYNFYQTKIKELA